MKTAGIIGGFGPEATAQFYLELIASCRNSFHAQPSLIIRNVVVPEKLENDVLLNAKGVQSFTPLLTQAIRDLESSGATFLVLPCNTLHVLTPHIRRIATKPFISIIEQTVQLLHKNNITSIGLLGTSVTVNANLFAKIDSIISFVTPPSKLQKEIDRNLHLLVTTGKMGPLKATLNRAVKNIQARGTTNILIACTDFHGLIKPNEQITIFDTVEILALATKDALRGKSADMI